MENKPLKRIKKEKRTTKEKERKAIFKKKDKNRKGVL